MPPAPSALETAKTKQVNSFEVNSILSQIGLLPRRIIGGQAEAPKRVLSPEELSDIAQQDGKLATLAAMTAANALIDRVANTERWALSRMLVTMLARKMQPGARLHFTERASLGVLAWEQLTRTLAERDLYIAEEGLFLVVREQKRNPTTRTG